jgi:hypothetical protein
MTRPGKQKATPQEAAESHPGPSAEQNGGLHDGASTSGASSAVETIPCQQLARRSDQQAGHDISHDITSLLQSLAVQQHQQEKKDSWDFWGTQPVAQFNEDPRDLPVSCHSCLVNLSSSVGMTLAQQQPLLLCAIRQQCSLVVLLRAAVSQ